MQLQSMIRKNKSINYTLPAPIKGLNVRDSLANMDAQYAITMDNYIPLDTKVALRKGYVEYVALPEKVCTLAEYKRGYYANFLAISGSKLYNISNRQNVYSLDNVEFTYGYCQT